MPSLAQPAGIAFLYTLIDPTPSSTLFPTWCRARIFPFQVISDRAEPGQDERMFWRLPWAVRRAGATAAAVESSLRRVQVDSVIAVDYGATGAAFQTDQLDAR